MPTRRMTLDEIQARFSFGPTNYFRTVVTIVARDEYEESLASGLGLMSFLLRCDFWLSDYASAEDPDGGSTSGAAEIASFLFSHVERNSSWWLAEYIRAPEFPYLGYWSSRFSSYDDVRVSEPDRWTN